MSLQSSIDALVNRYDAPEFDPYAICSISHMRFGGRFDRFGDSRYAIAHGPEEAVG